MYLDPGFGSMIIQIVVALLAACGAVLILMKARIKVFFTKRKHKIDASEIISNDKTIDSKDTEKQESLQKETEKP